MGKTILDVAKKAGVSPSTVSLVINGSERVSYKTKEKIQKIIKEMGYIPNRGARSIVTSRTSNIGLLVILEDNVSKDPYSIENIVNSFSTDISAGVEEEIQPTHYGLIYARANGKSAKDLPKIVDSSYIDGLIITGGSYTKEFLKAIEKTGIPTVITGSNYMTKRISSIFCDPYTAMKEMILYLISKGRRNIGFLNSSSVSYNTEPKLRGYQDALLESNIPCNEKMVISAGFSAMDGRIATKELLSKGIDIDAIACAFDGLAIGALHELISRKIEVPKDIALSGFEDSWIASHAIPSLTTVRIPKFDIGKMLLNNLLDILNGKINPGFKMLVESEIVIREST
ncbi:LacI family transcriptional regulator [Treponema sp. OttesenSCG-928-L16]|nr:LacI family transcriptional regulator [Treponema sp. OttesenSCG-928-L16]